MSNSHSPPHGGERFDATIKMCFDHAKIFDGTSDALFLNSYKRVSR
jgi:hypothetical protein